MKRSGENGDVHQETEEVEDFLGIDIHVASSANARDDWKAKADLQKMKFSCNQLLSLKQEFADNPDNPDAESEIKKFPVIDDTNISEGVAENNDITDQRIRYQNKLQQCKKDASRFNKTNPNRFINYYSVGDQISGLDPKHPKTEGIRVEIEELTDGKLLVKVGPHDLSGVGGHAMRAKIIEHVAKEAIKEYDHLGSIYRNENGVIPKESYAKFRHEIEEHYKAAHVSACATIRGRALNQRRPFFKDKNPGSHQNAFIKVSGETSLTRWEPRDGPQSFFNDTICGMVAAVSTFLFEEGVKAGKITSSKDATTDILKSKSLKEIFVDVLRTVRNKIDDVLIPKIKAFARDLCTKESRESRPG